DVPPLPTERRMHDDGLGAELLSGPHTAIQLGNRVGSPHPLRYQQTRRMYRQHRHPVAPREFGHRADVLADRLAPHHQLDTVVTEVGCVLESGLGLLWIDRGRRQTDFDSWAHVGSVAA